MSFQSQIQQWVSIDNQLKKINEQTKELRERRNNLTTLLLDYAETNNLGNRIIQISDGKLKFTNTKVSEPLSYKYLEKTLSEIIKNPTHVESILEHIKQKRNFKTVAEIKRFYNE